MLPKPLERLIRAEHLRGTPGFLAGVDLDQYLAKIDRHAEFVSDMDGDRCRALVAYYCNDSSKQLAFITLVVVDPVDRRAGLGRTLVARVLDIARNRGFAACRLEVGDRNEAAAKLYEGLGFKTIETQPGKVLMEARL